MTRKKTLIIAFVVILIIFGAVSWQTSKSSVVAPSLTPKANSQIETKIQQSKHNTQITSPDPVVETSSDLDADRDFLLWNGLSEEAEKEWEKEIYSHIQYVDRENADELYKLYLAERRNYLAEIDSNPNDRFDDLSRLNGESIYNQKEHLELEIIHDEYVGKIRRLFREHYRYIEGQRKIFVDNHPLEI